MLRLLIICLSYARPTSPYSFSLSTFSPEGGSNRSSSRGKPSTTARPAQRLRQAADGGVEKSDSTRSGRPQLAHSAGDGETIATYAGLPADFRALVDAARAMARARETNGPPSAPMLATESAGACRSGRSAAVPALRLLPYTRVAFFIISRRPVELGRSPRACAAGAGSASIQADLAAILDEDGAAATAPRRCSCGRPRRRRGYDETRRLRRRGRVGGVH